MRDYEKILVIEKNSSNKIKIKGSQFVGYSFRITNPEDAQTYINQLKKELSSYHKTKEFLEMKTMGEILTLHLEKKLGIEIFPIKKII